MEVEMSYSTNHLSRLMTKVFGWMALALLVTVVVAGGGAAFLVYALPKMVDSALAANIYLGVLIAASILQVVLLIIIQVMGVFKQQKSTLIPFLAYAVCMGILLSSIVAYVDMGSIILAFGATCICFGSMAFIGFITKGNMRVPYMVAMGAILGAGLLALFNFLYGIMTGTSIGMIGWLVSGLIFFFLMIVTAIDIHSIKRIAQNGDLTRNLAIYCAFHLYYDFIMIFIRVLSYIGIMRRD